MAGITERKANPKKSRNQTVAGLDFLSTPTSTTSEPPTPGPSRAKIPDPSDTDDHEMDTTDELVCHPPLSYSESHYLFSSRSDPVTEAEITLVDNEDPKDGTLDSRI